MKALLGAFNQEKALVRPLYNFTDLSSAALVLILAAPGARHRSHTSHCPGWRLPHAAPFASKWKIPILTQKICDDTEVAELHNV